MSNEEKDLAAKARQLGMIRTHTKQATGIDVEGYKPCQCAGDYCDKPFLHYFLRRLGIKRDMSDEQPERIEQRYLPLSCPIIPNTPNL